MTVDEAERVRALLHGVDFPEPRHDLAQTVRVGRRRKAARWTAAVATGAAALVGIAVVAAVVRPAPSTVDRAVSPPQGSDCEIEHLALPAGVGSAVANSIDPTGRYVAGTSDDGRTILWTDGRPALLPADAVGVEDVNASGVVVGTYGTGSGDHAWVYRDGRFERLPVPGGEAARLSINTRGDIAGTLHRDGLGTVPIVWPAAEPGTYRLAETPDTPVVEAITDSGAVLGGLQSAGPYRWDADGTGRALATLPGLTRGNAVDAAGNWAAGLLQIPLDSSTVTNSPPGGLAAVRWNLTTGEVTAIGVDALPVGVDPAGQVLIPENPPRLVGLDRGVRPLPPDRGFHRTVATGISDNGIVVGGASTNDKDPNAGPPRTQPIRWICSG